LLRLYQSINPGPRLCLWTFRNKDTFSRWGVVNPSPKLQTGGPPLVGCPRLLIHYIRSYPPSWRQFLHPQLKDAPCRGGRDPLITWNQLALNSLTQRLPAIAKKIMRQFFLYSPRSPSPTVFGPRYAYNFHL
jgi:hypothetical protein